MKAVGLIMAAGLSQRMGQFKPLLPIGGKPMIERTLSTCLQANIRENFVVVGHCAHLVVQALRHMDVRFLYNAAYQTADMLSSVQLGLDHIATQTDADAAFLLPADMPAISPRLMPRLLSCMGQTGADVVFPSREMRRMHPPLLHRRCFNLVTGYAGEGGRYNFVGNYYKPGPSTITKKNIVNRIFSPNGDDGKQKNPRGMWGTFHLSGNFFDDSCPSLPSAWKPLLEAVNKNNREGLQPNTGNGVPLPSGGVDALLAAKEFVVSTDAAAFTQSAADAYESVLRLAGASLKRDAVDARIVENVRRGDFTAPGSNGSNYGIIDNEQDVGGWPAYAGTTLKDTDGDGMPDAWERAHGLDPDRDDSAAYNLSKEYTNLEVYYNGLVENLYGN